MKKLPISIIIDDPAPGIHTYYHHIKDHVTKDGRPLEKFVPNDLLKDFCDLVEEYGLGGKYSVIPMPGCQGDILNGLTGVSDETRKEWISIVRTRLMPYFDLCPEILTHSNAVNLATGEFYEQNEEEWCVSQTRRELTPYIARAVEMLDKAGLTPTGVTSPWYFGSKNEEEYQQAISHAFDDVLGKKDVWYFLHSCKGRTDVFPEVVIDEDGRRLVSVTATFRDNFWQCIDTTDTSDELIRRIADIYITEDGTDGEIVRMVNANCPPVMITHWQSMFSNGNRTGLRALRLVCERVKEHLSDRVEWVNMSGLMKRAIDGEFRK